jgi:hypothetical protein
MMKIFNASVSHFQKEKRKKKVSNIWRIIKMTKLSKVLSSTIHFELVDGRGGTFMVFQWSQDSLYRALLYSPLLFIDKLSFESAVQHRCQFCRPNWQALLIMRDPTTISLSYESHYFSLIVQNLLGWPIPAQLVQIPSVYVLWNVQAPTH